MSEGIDNYSFSDLLKKEKIKVRIPKIQRDYAQGRRNPKVDEIRKLFVHSLLMVVEGKEQSIELDFVYGSHRDEASISHDVKMTSGEIGSVCGNDRRDAFEPLDGQQRLTTLFLLYWMMGALSPQDSGCFTYETRNTSADFCQELLLHDAYQFISEAWADRSKNVNQGREGEHQPVLPSEIIKGRDWFQWAWRHDPTILSMLVMIDSIYEAMSEDLICSLGDEANEYRANLEHITFHLLDLGAFGLSDELFIKMNARGKQLSDFDKLKSSLEEELQLQQSERDADGNSLATPETETQWRRLMDGVWIDFFWHNYAKKVIENNHGDDPIQFTRRWQAAEQAEGQFRKLLLRLIALQFFERDDITDSLKEASYRLSETEVGNLLLVYTDSLLDDRSGGEPLGMSGAGRLDLQRLMDDVDLLIYRESNHTFRDVTALLDERSRMSKNNAGTLLESFLGYQVPNDVRLTFYSLLLYLRHFPMAKEGNGWDFDEKTHKPWLKNLEDWVRVSRNLLLLTNTNQRIDKIGPTKIATQSLKSFVDDFVSFVRHNSLDLESDPLAVKKFLISTQTNYTWLDNQSMKEERDKARLILSHPGTDWTREIDLAEEDDYLWGQIRCLLNWADDDLTRFQEYSDKLRKILGCLGDDRYEIYAALLAVQPDYWRYTDNRLYDMTKDRDNSIKRYLREHTNNEQMYGAVIKQLIDKWMSPAYSEIDCCTDFAVKFAHDHWASVPPWVQCIIDDPSILRESIYKRVYEEDGHVILPQRKTIDSHCYDPILLYGRNLCNNSDHDVSDCTFGDSKSEPPHFLSFESNGVKYTIHWAESNGLYAIQTGTGVENPLTY